MRSQCQSRQKKCKQRILPKTPKRTNIKIHTKIISILESFSHVAYYAFSPLAASGVGGWRYRGQTEYATASSIAPEDSTYRQ